MVTFVVTAKVMATMSPNCMYSRLTWSLLEGNTWLIRSLFVFKIKCNGHWWPHVRLKLIMCYMGQMWPNCLHYTLSLTKLSFVCLLHHYMLRKLKNWKVRYLEGAWTNDLKHRCYVLTAVLEDFLLLHQNLGFIICSYKHLNSYFPSAMKLATDARAHKPARIILRN